MLRSLHIDVIVARPARIKGGWDGAEVIATFGVRKDVSAIAVATIVVFAVLVGMPQSTRARSTGRQGRSTRAHCLEFGAVTRGCACYPFWAVGLTSILSAALRGDKDFNFAGDIQIVSSTL
jgi:hypothetical protein